MPSVERVGRIDRSHVDPSDSGVVGPKRAMRVSVRVRPVHRTGRKLPPPEAARLLTIKPEDGKVAAGSVSITAQGPRHAEVTTFNFNDELSSHLNITSWSMA